MMVSMMREVVGVMMTGMLVVVVGGVEVGVEA
jgi:hypothetical protein